MVTKDSAEILRRLVDSHVEVIVVGMAAGILQGVPTTTRDLDIVHRRPPESFLGLLEELVLDLYTSPGPIVASLDGHAIAGGCVLALACDLRIASDNPKAVCAQDFGGGAPLERARPWPNARDSGAGNPRHYRQQTAPALAEDSTACSLVHVGRGASPPLDSFQLSGSR